MTGILTEQSKIQITNSLQLKEEENKKILYQKFLKLTGLQIMQPG
jgi:hypothetical protein